MLSAQFIVILTATIVHFWCRLGRETRYIDCCGEKKSCAWGNGNYKKNEILHAYRDMFALNTKQCALN